MNVPLPSQAHIRKTVSSDESKKPNSSTSPSTPMESDGSNPSEKPKFVRKPHLTERPFKNHEGLQALRDSLKEGPKGRKSPYINKKRK